MAMRKGERAVADELLSKMAELNEKLGENMQALEDEVTTSLRGVADCAALALATAEAAASEGRGDGGALDRRELEEGLAALEGRLETAQASTAESLAAELESARQSAREELHVAVTGLRTALEEELRDVRAGAAKAAEDAVNGLRGELQAGVSEVKAESSETHDAELAQAAGNGVRVEAMADPGGSLEEALRRCDDVRREAQAEAEDVRQRMQSFCEEMVGMVADLHNEACGGCFEVQKGLETTATRLSVVEEEDAQRSKRLSVMEERLGGAALKTESPTLEEVAARLVALEGQVQGGRDVCASGGSSPPRPQQGLELSTCDWVLTTSPGTLSEAYGQLAAFEERLEAHRGAQAAEQLRLERRLVEAERELAVLPGALAQLAELQGEISPLISRATPLQQLEERLDAERETVRGDVALLEERLEAIVQAATAAESVRVETYERFHCRQESQASELAGLRKAMGEHKSDVLRAQGGADAAYAAATRLPDWTAQLDAAKSAWRREWKAQQRELVDVREEARASASKGEATAVEMQRQCRAWVDGALSQLEDLALRTRERLAALATELREEREACKAWRGQDPEMLLETGLAPLRSRLESLAVALEAETVPRLLEGLAGPVGEVLASPAKECCFQPCGLAGGGHQGKGRTGAGRPPAVAAVPTPCRGGGADGGGEGIGAPRPQGASPHLEAGDEPAPFELGSPLSSTKLRASRRAAATINKATVRAAAVTPSESSSETSSVAAAVAMLGAAVAKSGASPPSASCGAGPLAAQLSPPSGSPLSGRTLFSPRKEPVSLPSPHAAG
mmetsp:Transcript_62440/g.140772  ORF Transcript_62440/g.140772 Transcript_62440/m.140772 type:complete len:800 (+) Transcript_62440:287-2686(+)